MTVGDLMKRRSYSSPEDIHEIALLRDLYEDLLPPRQRQVAELKFDEDLYLSEMAQRLGISRQGCDDAIKRCVNALFLYEEKLGMKQKTERFEERLRKIRELCETMDEDNWNEHRKQALMVIDENDSWGEYENGI